MSAQFDQDDIKTLSEILEVEHKHHCQKRSICFWLFIFWFVLLIVALGIAAYLVLGPVATGPMGGTLAWVQALTALSAAVVSFFSMWWTVQNCINSIERTLFAARAGRTQLFASLLEQVQCADKEKRRLWLEVIKAAVS
jgi:hypothetical protein